MTRLAALLAALGAPLAFAGTGQAAFAPKLVVSSGAVQAAGASAPTRIGVTVGNGDDQVARFAILVPAGYQIAAASPGRLGAVAATVSTVGGAILPLSGELDAVVATPATDAIAAQCQVTPSQTWALALAAAGQTLSMPLFVAASPLPGYAAAAPTRSDLYFHDMGASGCVELPGLAFPCTDVTVGGETIRTATTVRGFE